MGYLLHMFLWVRPVKTMLGLLDGQLGILDHSTQQLSTAQCKMQSIKTAISGMHQNTRLTDIKTTQTRLNFMHGQVRA